MGMDLERIRSTDAVVHPDFRVGQDVEGHWLVVETHGLGGGMFIDRDAAWRYALHETARRPGAISLAQEPLALR